MKNKSHISNARSFDPNSSVSEFKRSKCCWELQLEFGANDNSEYAYTTLILYMVDRERESEGGADDDIFATCQRFSLELKFSSDEGDTRTPTEPYPNCNLCDTPLSINFNLYQVEIIVVAALQGKHKVSTCSPFTAKCPPKK